MTRLIISSDPLEFGEKITSNPSIFCNNYVSIYTYIFRFTRKQKTFLKSLVTSHNYATSTSFVAAISIGSKGKPLTGGEFLKMHS